jgi:hypothetical protein
LGKCRKGSLYHPDVAHLRKRCKVGVYAGAISPDTKQQKEERPKSGAHFGAHLRQKQEQSVEKHRTAKSIEGRINTSDSHSVAQCLKAAFYN